MLIPRQKAPQLNVELLGGGRYDLAADNPELFSLVCFYRGLHCPICANYLTDLERQTPAFAERSVTTVAISSDGEERARQMADKVGADQLRFGYGLSLEAARDWGLYISTSRGMSSLGIEEPALFSEPAVFLIRPDETIYYLSVQSMPFARPNFREMVQAVDFVVKNGYPARGEYTGAV